MTYTEEQNAEMIAALIRERDGYERLGLDDRVREVDEELARWGANAKPPAKRAATRRKREA